MTKGKFYVRAETAKSKVVAYGVYDCVGGLESEHARYRITEDLPADAALYLANQQRDDLNAGIA